MLIGSASTVTMVSVNRLRLVSSATLRGDLFLQQLDAFLQRGHVAQHHVNSSVDWRSSSRSAPAIQAGGGQQAEQRARLGRQQPLQPHRRRRSRPGRRACGAAPGQQLVLDVVDCARGAAHDAPPAHRPGRAAGGRAARRCRAASPRLTAVRSRSTERSGRRRALTTSARRDADPQRGHVGGSNPKSKATSLITPNSVSPSRSMRVEREPSRSASKKTGPTPACRSSQGCAPVWLEVDVHPNETPAVSFESVGHRTQCLDGLRRRAWCKRKRTDQRVVVVADGDAKGRGHAWQS